jgi:hypothetical protein
MDSSRAYFVDASPPTTTLPGIARFLVRRGALLDVPTAGEQACAVLVALETIDADECPALLYGSHAWPPASVPRNLEKLGTLATSLERGDCIALDLNTAWKLRGTQDTRGESWLAKTAVIVFGGDDATGGEEVWLDELRGTRGFTPTTVVQWSKGVPPPDEQHYT